MKSKNKRGMEGIMVVFLAVVLMLALAFGAALLIGVSNNIMDEFTPVINELGVIQGSGLPGDNLTQNANYVFTPLNSAVNSMNWLVGLGYFVSLIIIIGLAIGYRMTGQKYLVVFFLLLVLLSLVLSITLSNAYEDLHTGTDVLAVGLQDQTLLSWLIINSPITTLIVMFIAGVIMFTANPEEAIFQ